MEKTNDRAERKPPGRVERILENNAEQVAANSKQIDRLTKHLENLTAQVNTLTGADNFIATIITPRARDDS